MSHVYVLALTSRDSPAFTVDGRRIEFVTIENVVAVIERRAAPPEATETELRSQHAVVTAIFNRMEDLLPVRFGAWLDREELSSIVAKQERAIGDALELVRGRVQMTIRFLAAARPAREDQRPRQQTGTGTEYLQSRRNAEQWMPDDAIALRGAVSDLVVAERVHPGSIGSAGSFDSARVRQIPSLYHLIARDAVTAYATATLPYRSATVTVTGPWPPFAFAPDPWL